MELNENQIEMLHKIEKRGLIVRMRYGVPDAAWKDTDDDVGHSDWNIIMSMFEEHTEKVRRSSDKVTLSFEIVTGGTRYIARYEFLSDFQLRLTSKDVIDYMDYEDGFSIGNPIYEIEAGEVLFNKVKRSDYIKVISVDNNDYYIENEYMLTSKAKELIHAMS